LVHLERFIRYFFKKNQDFRPALPKKNRSHEFRTSCSEQNPTFSNYTPFSGFLSMIKIKSKNKRFFAEKRCCIHYDIKQCLEFAAKKGQEGTMDRQLID
jgi:hypothetical protein